MVARKVEIITRRARCARKRWEVIRATPRRASRARKEGIKMGRRIFNKIEYVLPKAEYLSWGTSEQRQRGPPRRHRAAERRRCRRFRA